MRRAVSFAAVSYAVVLALLGMGAAPAVAARHHPAIPRTHAVRRHVVDDYSRPVGSPSDPVLSTGWTHGHGARQTGVHNYYRHTKSGRLIHVHSYYRRRR